MFVHSWYFDKSVEKWNMYIFEKLAPPKHPPFKQVLWSKYKIIFLKLDFESPLKTATEFSPY